MSIMECPSSGGPQSIEHMWQDFLKNFSPSQPCSFHLLCPCYKCSSLYKTSQCFTSLGWIPVECAGSPSVHSLQLTTHFLITL